MNHSIVGLIPCYNVAQHCEEIVKETSLYCTHLIVIDDGSTDGTSEILKRMSSLYPNKIHLIEFQSNQGKGFGLIEGFKYASENFDFEVLVTLDSDGQHAARFIPQLVEPIFKGADLVIGSRLFSGMPLKNRLSNKIIAFLLRLVYRNAPIDTQSGMRGFSSSMIERLVQSIDGGRYEMEFRCLLLALREKKSIVEVPIPTIYINKNRSSHFAPLIDSYRILKVLWDHLYQK